MVASTDLVLAEEVLMARGPRERLRGLRGRLPLRPGQALLLQPAAQVHTFGMRYSIDVVFLDRDGTVLHVVRDMKARRLSRWVRGSRWVLELPAGCVPGEVVPGTKVRVYEGREKGQYARS